MSLRALVEDLMVTQGFVVVRTCEGSLADRFRAYQSNKIMGSIRLGEQDEAFIARVPVLLHLKAEL